MNANVTLPWLSAYRVTGADAFAFLQAQLAADVAALPDGQATFAAFCSARGQVICLLLVQRRGAEGLLIGARELLDPAVQRLRRFVLRADVRFEAVTDAVSVAGSDPHAQGAAPTIRPAGTDLDYVLGDGMTDEAAAAAWKVRELRRGVLWLDHATSERFIPQMLGLERIGAVSFAKGCYPGQEVIARAHYLGTVKRIPAVVLVRAPARPMPGAPCAVLGGEDSAEGVVIDAAPADGGQFVTVVVTSLDPATPVEAVELETGTRLPAERIDG